MYSFLFISVWIIYEQHSFFKFISEKTKFPNNKTIITLNRSIPLLTVLAVDSKELIFPHKCDKVCAIYGVVSHHYWAKTTFTLQLETPQMYITYFCNYYIATNNGLTDQIMLLYAPCLCNLPFSKESKSSRPLEWSKWLLCTRKVFSLKADASSGSF